MICNTSNLSLIFKIVLRRVRILFGKSLCRFRRGFPPPSTRPRGTQSACHLSCHSPIDTPTKEIRAYPYDDFSGSIGEAEVIVNTEDHGWEGSPDGMTIDASGMLWVAMCHGGSVLRINPANGSLLQKIDFPCVETTACAFGGEKLDRLFVTTGIHKSIEESNAGRLFVVDGLGVNGTKAFAFAG